MFLCPLCYLTYKPPSLPAVSEILVLSSPSCDSSNSTYQASTLKTTTMLALTSLILLTATATASSKWKDFSQTCTEIDFIHGWYIDANCTNTDTGVVVRSELDLNLCIGLLQETGQLQWEPYGKFRVYCKHCNVAPDHQDSPILTCSCTPMFGHHYNKTVEASINLDTGVGVAKGYLACDGAAPSDGTIPAK
ncbi:hypothetical protein QBC35DRAFT_485033 [Podospora australis]|uniref:Cyanovirin-N domain-containing protein n=1 Tax=Podospora australis TaxID=1536484 RepID=A0AAN7AMP4_9PEZI|nr:hypothetical protein QBC35DRAFT_485033 [Podospora australis]